MLIELEPNVELAWTGSAAITVFYLQEKSFGSRRWLEEEIDGPVGL